MSTFTMPLKTVIDHTGGTVTYENMEFMGASMGTIAKVTNSDFGIEFYPIFDESYRNILTGKIVDRYWNREIGVETIDMFRLVLRRRLNEVMPYYNELYKSTLIDFDPMVTIDVSTTSQSDATENVTSTGEGTTASETKSGSRAVNSTTPQTMLAGNEDYASAAADTNSTTTSDSLSNNESSSESVNTGTNESQTKGYQALPSNLIMQFRESLINVDMMIIGELEDLFMLVWDNNDAYTSGRIY